MPSASPTFDGLLCLDRDELPWWPYWKSAEDLFVAAVAPRTVEGEAGFRRELLFCLLSGWSVRYELASAAADRLFVLLDPLSSSLSDANLEARLRAELESPQFEITEGVMHRYRFPARKAAQIVAARSWLRAVPPVINQLRRLKPTDARRLLCECPGIGPKTASWLLRNLGFGTRVAILDVHVRRALTASGVLAEGSREGYEQVEALFLAWCDSLDADPAALDLFLWEWQRGSLRPA